MIKVALYPGSFNPITNGHLNIIRRAANLFDKLIIVLANQPIKRADFSIQTRLEFIQKVTKSISNVQVEYFEGLLASAVEKYKADVIVRSLRCVSDFEYETQMAMTNKSLNSKAETLFFVSEPQYSFISSSRVREIASMGGDIRPFIPRQIYEQIQNFYKD